MLVPALVPKGAYVRTNESETAAMVEKYTIKDDKLYVHFVNKKEGLELPSSQYHLRLARFSKVSTGFFGQKVVGIFLGVVNGKVFLLFPFSKSWRSLPPEVLISDPHDGRVTSSSMQIIRFPTMAMAATYVTPVTWISIKLLFRASI